MVPAVCREVSHEGIVALAPYARMKFRQVNNRVLLFRRSGKKDSVVDSIVSRYAGRSRGRTKLWLEQPIGWCIWYECLLIIARSGSWLEAWRCPILLSGKL
jgi:hypothetical protein